MTCMHMQECPTGSQITQAGDMLMEMGDFIETVLTADAQGDCHPLLHMRLCRCSRSPCVQLLSRNSKALHWELTTRHSHGRAG